MVTREKPANTQKKTSYAKWGYIFISAFFLVYLTFTLIPQIITIYDSFWDYSGAMELDYEVTFAGFKNYESLFKKNALGYVEILKCFGNTVIMWVIGAVPQMVIALLLALIFTATKLKLKFTGFFKTVYYLPNLIMAAAFAALFLALFGRSGPVFGFFVDQGWAGANQDFISESAPARILVATMNFLMWFGNTTILLMAGIQGIDESVFESARIDGAGSGHVLFDITLPLLKPIVVYVMITSMIGGLQMFDVPQILTDKAKNNETRTMVMLINDYLSKSNYGHAGAVSVILFIITGLLSIVVFKSITKKEN